MQGQFTVRAGTEEKQEKLSRLMEMTRIDKLGTATWVAIDFFIKHSKGTTYEAIKHSESNRLSMRLKDRDRIKAALERQEQIRRKHPAPQGWDSLSELRKWRGRQIQL